MKQLSGNEIRKLWLNFFKEKNHHILDSASLIPNSDPTLLWVNSGVATLKPYFDGRQTPPSKRMANCQKSIRTNDIENVGITARHQTLFEMLGNFSIGDYFKEDAIKYAWEFLTSEKWLNLDPDKLYVTIFEEDEVAFDIWLNTIKLKEHRIIKGTRKTNFWEIGAGPCGPNTEIFFDRGIKYDPQNIGLKLLEEDIENDRYLEIWNIVFSEFNSDGNGNYAELPRKNIDTGAGLERLALVLQEKNTNFETDLFHPIIDKVIMILNNKISYSENPQTKSEAEVNRSLRVIADHIRAATFSIADGVFPENKDRGYVIRRLIRRSVLYGTQLGAKEPFLYKIIKTVISTMGDYYSYLLEKQVIIEETVKLEEERFLQTLSKGKEILTGYISKSRNISGEQAFKLFESFGFPIELTVELAQQNNLTVDTKRFEMLLAEAKVLSQKSRQQTTSMSKQNPALLSLTTESEFVGYEKNAIDTKILAIIQDENLKDEVKNCHAYIVLEKTPFYAEKGGQASDRGTISNKNSIINVFDVQQGPNGQHIHYVEVIGTLKLGDTVTAQIDEQRRHYTMKNHSGTHIIHSALREVLGKHVMQIGSYNDDQKLRIDISHNKKISCEEIRKVNSLVITKIKDKIPCEVIYTDYKTAVEKHNALAFFNEKYTETVRIIRFSAFSCELCGGTHCQNTADIEDMLITNVQSKGATSYRVTAITSHKTISEYVLQRFSDLKSAISDDIDFFRSNKKILNSPQLDEDINIILGLTASKENLAELESTTEAFANHLLSYKKQLLNKKAQESAKNIPDFQPITVNNQEIIILNCPNQENIGTLKTYADTIKKDYPHGYIFVSSSNADNNINFVCSFNGDSYSVKNLINNFFRAQRKIEIKGGGSPTFGQGIICKLKFLEIKDLLMDFFNE